MRFVCPLLRVCLDLPFYGGTSVYTLKVYKCRISRTLKPISFLEPGTIFSLVCSHLSARIPPYRVASQLHCLCKPLFVKIDQKRKKLAKSRIKKLLQARLFNSRAVKKSIPFPLLFAYKIRDGGRGEQAKENRDGKKDLRWEFGKNLHPSVVSRISLAIRKCNVCSSEAFSDFTHSYIITVLLFKIGQKSFFVQNPISAVVTFFDSFSKRNFYFSAGRREQLLPIAVFRGSSQDLSERRRRKFNRNPVFLYPLMLLLLREKVKKVTSILKRLSSSFFSFRHWIREPSLFFSLKNYFQFPVWRILVLTVGRLLWGPIFYPPLGPIISKIEERKQV